MSIPEAVSCQEASIVEHPVHSWSCMGMARACCSRAPLREAAIGEASIPLKATLIEAVSPLQVVLSQAAIHGAGGRHCGGSDLCID